MDYETQTRSAYRTEQRAIAYQCRQTRRWSWARLATWREQRGVARILGKRAWAPADDVLDIPCGAGILGAVLARFPFRVVASDISPAMMALARGAYAADRFRGFVQADITDTPLRPGSFRCVITLGFMHRVPDELKRATLAAIATLSRELVIVSYSVDSPLQRLKRALLGFLCRSYESAPCSASVADILGDCRAAGLHMLEWYRPVPFLSAEVVLELEKTAGCAARPSRPPAAGTWEGASP